MRMRVRAKSLAICLLLFFPGHTFSNDKGAPRVKSELPFNLTSRELRDVSVTLGFSSSKTGAGRQEIRISGNGDITLYFSKSCNDKNPAVEKGKIELRVFTALLGMFEKYDFGTMDNSEGVEAGGSSRRFITLSTPKKEYRYIATDTSSYFFEQLYGAVKMAAAITMPRVLGNGFFPNL